MDDGIGAEGPNHDEPRKFSRQSSSSKRSSDGGGVFLDDEMMKKKVREALCKHEYNVADLYKPTGFWRDLATNPVFENLTLLVIGVNALWMAYDTDENDADVIIDAEPIFQVAENVFCLYFSFEWIVRFMSFRRKRDGLKDGWFVFDSALVFMMVGETWVMTIIALAAGGGGSLGGTSILRLFRLLRLSRMARMLRSMPELMILIKGMIAAFRSVFFTMFLLFIIIYIFAIALKQLTEDSYAGDLYFHGVPRTMWVLLINGTFLDNLTQVADDIRDSHILFAAVFLMFVALSALMIMNMLIGVLCEVVSAVAKSEKEGMAVAFVKGKMKSVMDRIDQDGNEKVSKKEFHQILWDREAIQALCEVGVDPVGLIDVGTSIFKSDDDDSDGEETELDFSDFMELVLSLRGSNVACVKDIVNVTKSFRAELRELDERVRSRLDLKPPSRRKSKQSNASGTKEANGRGGRASSKTAAPAANGTSGPGSRTDAPQGSRAEPVSTDHVVHPPCLPNQVLHHEPSPVLLFPPPLESNDSLALARVPPDRGDPPTPARLPQQTTSFAAVGNFVKIDVLLTAVLTELQHLQVHAPPDEMHPRVDQWVRRMERVITAQLREFHEIHMQRPIVP